MRQWAIDHGERGYYDPKTGQGVDVYMTLTPEEKAMWLPRYEERLAHWSQIRQTDRWKNASKQQREAMMEASRASTKRAMAADLGIGGKKRSTRRKRNKRKTKKRRKTRSKRR